MGSGISFCLRSVASMTGPKGKYESGKTSCPNCPTGWTANEAGRSWCYKCGGGQYAIVDCCCKGCPGGWVSSGEVTSCTKCLAGTYDGGGTAVTGGRTSCPGCPSGRYSGDEATSCTECKTCGGGQKRTAACTTSSNIVCDACDDNTWQDSGSHTDTECKPSAGCAVNGEKTGCDACPKGQAGTGSCAPCPANEYQDETGQASCKPCGACAKGHRQKDACSATGNTVCAACGGGKFQDTDNHHIDTCKECPKGWHQDSSGKSVCWTCWEVVDGATVIYQDETGKSDCKPCGKCGEGDRRSSPCSWNSADTACADCADPTWQDSTSHLHDACKPGSGCKVNTAKTTCTDCPKGKAGTGTCPVCEKGYWQNEGKKATCKKCPEGYFTDQKEQQSCKPCAKGHFQDEKAKQSCDECPKGWHVNSCPSLCESRLVSALFSISQ